MSGDLLLFSKESAHIITIFIRDSKLLHCLMELLLGNLLLLSHLLQLDAHSWVVVIHFFEITLQSIALKLKFLNSFILLLLDFCEPNYLSLSILHFNNSGLYFLLE